MGRFLLIVALFSSLLFATNAENNSSKVKVEKKVKKVAKISKDSNNTKTKVKTQTQKQIEIEMEREKKFAREQKFYSEKDYDFQGSEVNMESVKKLKEPENLDYFDMNSVYD